MKNLVLIIEDNADNFYLMRYLLEHRGFKVLGADSGWMGIELAHYNNPDIILLDIQLPGMDGYEIARQLKKDPELCVIPVIAVTSYAMPQDREQAFAAGVNGYIEKPINPDSFVDEIARFLPEKGAEQ